MAGLTKKRLIAGAGLIAVLGALWVGYFYYKNLQGIWPAILPAPSDLVEDIPSVTAKPTTSTAPLPSPSIPLKLPQGFSIELLAKDLSGARVMIFDSQGNLWVSRTGPGIVTLLTMEDGVVTAKRNVFTGLRKPHGLAFDPDDPSTLYIAEENHISKVKVYPEGKLEKVVDLPTSGNHFTRTIGFGPAAPSEASAKDGDKRLYISVGSTCNVCNEADWRRAKILVMNKDGSGLKEYAKGLRNSVFFQWRPGTKEMWATDNGRDLLGDNIPPDEVNIVKEGQNYGWPNCYGKNIHDSDFDKNTYIRNPCQEPFEQSSYIDLQAHSAPLGLAFIPSYAKASDGQAQNWPPEYRGDLLVAYHGSWNRTVPTGYKVMRFGLDGAGTVTDSEDFITGFFPAGGKGTSAALGRPVDLLFGKDGALYISDDKAGAIYRVVYTGIPKVTCMPRPACLDMQPACLMPEPAEGWCHTPSPTAVSGTCTVGGCSGELCYDSNDRYRASICIWREEFACYKTARCERQSDGQCDWTQTEELKQCLSSS